MSKNGVRNALIFSAVLTIVAFAMDVIFKPNIRVVDEEGNVKANIYSGKKGVAASNKKPGFLDALGTFVNILYTIINIILTLRLFKELKN